MVDEVWIIASWAQQASGQPTNKRRVKMGRDWLLQGPWGETGKASLSADGSSHSYGSVRVGGASGIGESSDFEPVDLPGLRGGINSDPQPSAETGGWSLKSILRCLCCCSVEEDKEMGAYPPASDSERIHTRAVSAVVPGYERADDSDGEVDTEEVGDVFAGLGDSSGRRESQPITVIATDAHGGSGLATTPTSTAGWSGSAAGSVSSRLAFVGGSAPREGIMPTAVGGGATEPGVPGGAGVVADGDAKDGHDHEPGWW